MTAFTIDYLANKPEHINACAAWAYGRWGVQNPKGSLERAIEKFKDGAQLHALPLTLIAYDDATNLAIGMASLWQEDGDVWPDVTPWIASVYTLYKYRGQGVASQLITKLEKEAASLEYKEIYLQSGSAAEFYVKLGYNKIETRTMESTASGDLTLFKKKLI